MDIMTGLSAISETLKITKELRQIDSKIDEAEWKLRIADMVDKLLEAKEALVDAKENEATLRDEIQALKKAAEESGRLEDDNGLLFEIDENGTHTGKPFCNLCYVNENKKIRLVRTSVPSRPFKCNNCKNRYSE